MAATLMEIKSRLLLPRSDELIEEEEDPGRKLVRQLLEYKKIKEPRRSGAQQNGSFAACHASGRGDSRRGPASQPLRAVELGIW